MSSEQSINFVQHAYFVEDAVAAAQQWAQAFGAGPFFVMEHIPLTDVVFRGRPGTLDHTSAYGQFGDTMVELVQQNCAAPSVFTDHPYALHHMAAFAEDLDTCLADLAAVGIPTAMTAATASSGLRFAFADARALSGHYIELYQDEPSIRDFYQFVKAAAGGWDGRDPVRRP